MTLNNKIADIVEFYRDSQLVERIGDDYSLVKYNGDQYSSILHRLEEAQIISLFDVDESIYKFYESLNFFYTPEEFLSKAERRINPPSSFYVASEDWYFHASAGDHVSEKYRSIIELFELLKEISDYKDYAGNDAKLIIIYGKKIIVTSDYDYSELLSIDLDQVSLLKEECIFSDAHSDKKKDILKSVISEIYSDHDFIRLGYIASHLSSIYSRMDHGYDLFVAEFSYEKIKSEAERDKLEFNTRLNKVFSDIQNQLLAIPAALLLVGSQLKDSSDSGFGLGNLSIWLGVIVFSILMEILIKNQKNTLEAVHREIHIQEQMFKEKQLKIFPKFKNIYDSLEDRFIHQCRLLWVIRVLVAVILGLTTHIFLVNSFSWPLADSFLSGLFLMVFYLLAVYVVDGGKLYKKDGE